MISIVIPTFNSEKTLQRTLDSIGVIQAIQKNIQIIVMDGESTDRTRDICESSNILLEFISERDYGVYDAMNKSLTRVQNDWILFLGSDDVLLPSCLEAFPLLVDPERTYYGDVILARDGRRYGGSFSLTRLALTNICHQAIFYSRKALANQTFNLEFKLLADYDLNLRLASIGVPFEYIPVLIAEYNNITGMSTICRDERFKKRKLVLIQEYYGTTFAVKYILSALVINKFLRHLPYLKKQIVRI